MSPDFLKPRQSTHRYPTDFLLGDLLVKAGIVSQKQLDEAVQSAGGKHLNVGQMLIVSRYITARDLGVAIDAQSALRDRVVDMNSAIRGLKAACRAGIPFLEAVRGQDPTATKSIPTNKLGELLLEAGIINGDQFGKALQRSLATGLPLGRILVLNGAISETLLTTALEIQVRVRDDMLGRQEAIDYLKVTANQGSEEGLSPESALKIQALLKAPRKSGIRLGELLVLAGVLGETDVMNALELGLVNDQPIGQILVAQGFVSTDLLDSALRMQELVDSGHLDGTEASERLRKIHEDGLSFSEVVEDIELEEPPRPEINFQTMLTLGRVVSEDDFQAAFDLALTSPQVVATVLMMTGYMDEGTGDAALKCHSMIADGYLNQEDALVALDYCLQKLAERPITYEEALQELGWSLPPELMDGIGVASLHGQAPPSALSFAIDGIEPIASLEGTSFEDNSQQAGPFTAESQTIYENGNGADYDAPAEHNGSNGTADSAAALLEPEDEAQSKAVEQSDDWSLPETFAENDETQPPMEKGLAANETKAVAESEQFVVTYDDAEPAESVSASQDNVKRAVSLSQMKESARQLSQNRVSQSNRVDAVAEAATGATGNGVGSAQADAPSLQTAAVNDLDSTLVSNSANNPPGPGTLPVSDRPVRKVSLKTLLNTGGGKDEANGSRANADKPPQTRDLAEATIDPDAAIAAIPENSLRVGKSPELELSEFEQAVIAKASSLGATVEDMEAAARIVSKKQEALRALPVANPEHMRSEALQGPPVVELKKKIPESDFDPKLEVSVQNPEPIFDESKKIDYDSGSHSSKPKFGESGLGALLGKGKLEGTNGSAQPGKQKGPGSGLGAHLAMSKAKGNSAEETPSKAKFEDSGLGAHLGNPKSRGAGLGTLLSKPKLDQSAAAVADASAPGSARSSLALPNEATPGIDTRAALLNSLGSEAKSAGADQVAVLESPDKSHLDELSRVIAPGLPEEDPFVLNDSFIRLAESYYEQGKYQEAEDLYTRILSLRESAVGLMDPNIVNDLNNLAGVLCVQGKFKEAEPHVERAVELIERLEPGESLKLADSLNTLAGIYFQQDNFDQCETLLMRALNIRKLLLGEDHQDVADNLRDYAKFLRKIDRAEEAEKYYAEAKEIVARAQKRQN